MATTQLEADKTWVADSNHRYTASGDTDILLSNHSQTGRLYFTITANDTLPTIDPARASFVPSDRHLPMQLLAGERLWLAANPPTTAAIEA